MNLQTKIKVHAFSLVICTSLLGCADKDPVKDEAKTSHANNTLELVEADLVSISEGQLTPSIAFTGTIQPIHQTSIQAQVSATALSVFAEVGQYVNKGKTLVRLNNQDNSARLAQAQANLASAKAQAELNRSVMQRKGNLYNQGFISKLEYEQSQLEYRAQQENVKAQQANVDIAQKASQDTIITSPISGYVTARQVDVGQTVSLGQTLFEVVDSTQIEIKANIPASQQTSLNIGQKITFNIQGNQQQYSATVTRISPVANQVSRNIEFFAKPDTTTQSLSIGSFIDGQVRSSSTQSGQLIPLKSIQSIKDQPYVWLVRDNKLHKSPVQVLQIDERQELALVSGLLNTDKVSLVKFNTQDINKAIRLQ